MEFSLSLNLLLRNGNIYKGFLDNVSWRTRKMKEVVYSFGKRSVCSILSHAINHTIPAIKNAVWHVSSIPEGNSGNITYYGHPCNTGDDGGLETERSPAIPFHEWRKPRIKHLPKARVENPPGRRMPSLNRTVFTKLIVSHAKHLLLIGGGGSG